MSEDRTIKVDPIEELLKASVIVGAMTPAAADNIRALLARARATCDRPAALVTDTNENTVMNSVFLLWDRTREAKGEPPELVDVFATEEAARARGAEMFAGVDEDEDEDEDPLDLEVEDFGVERRHVQGSANQSKEQSND